MPIITINPKTLAEVKAIKLAKAPSEGKYWKQVRFLCIRNPVSNFGKRVLSISETAKWAWLEDKQVFGNFYWMYGWKNPVNDLRTFVYRPWFKKDNK